MITPELLQSLRSPAGLELLARAERLADDPFAVERLRKEAAPDCPWAMTAAAVEQVRLRRRAAARYSHAAGMWFAPGLLEQASGEAVSGWRARRFARWATGEPRTVEVGDFCCGLGGDTLALAAAGLGRDRPVTAVDRDPLALALTRANAEARGLADRVETSRGELPGDAPRVAAAWVDPGRREGGRRTRRLASLSPPLEAVLSLRARIPELGIKLSPAGSDAELDAALRGIPHEREFLSVSGECRELVIWTGGLAAAGEGEAPRRATLLPAGVSLAGAPRPYGPVRPPGAWLLEPDAAVIRAGLTANLAERLGAWPIDPRLAFLAAASPVQTCFATLYRVGAAEPFSARALAAYLRGVEAGDVVLKTRGFAAEPETLRQRLRGVLKHGRPDRRPVVFVTRLGGDPVMIAGERFEPGAAQNR